MAGNLSLFVIALFPVDAQQFLRDLPQRHLAGELLHGQIHARTYTSLVELAKELRNADQRGEALGLNSAEMAFYDALNDNGSAGALGDDTLRKIAAELLDKIRRNASIDWQKRESVRARLRNLVRITLRRYHYPPDKQEQAIDLVLEQAERMADVISDPESEGA